MLAIIINLFHINDLGQIDLSKADKQLFLFVALKWPIFQKKVFFIHLSKLIRNKMIPA